MYKVYSSEGYGGGDFTAKLDHCESVHLANTYKKVGNYQLLFKKSDNYMLHSDYMTKQKKAADVIIEATRIVSIKDHNDALTLEVDFISCNHFLNEITKLIDPEFL